MAEEFFEPLPDPPPPERYEPPVWLQPPAGELATLVPVRQVLARSDLGVVVVLSHIDVFSTGCTFRIRSSVHRHDGMDDAQWCELLEAATAWQRRWPQQGTREAALRFGVQFSDGRKVTTGGPVSRDDLDRQPDGHVLIHHGGRGGGGDLVVTYSWPLWLWPLPPAEPFDLVVAWPAVGIGLTRVEMSGRDIVDAANDARPLLHNTPP